MFNSASYCIGDTMIDVGDEWKCFMDVCSVLLTHAHFDHIYGLNELWDINNDIKVYTNRFGLKALLDARLNMSFYHSTPFVFAHPDNIVVVEDGEILELSDGLEARVIFTPGHNPSCITWMIGDMLFTGDAYIPGIKTVTTLPGGDRQQAVRSEKSIKKLMQGLRIYPGHQVEDTSSGLE